MGVVVELVELLELVELVKVKAGRMEKAALLASGGVAYGPVSF